jgi:hypothetical protein
VNTIPKLIWEQVDSNMGSFFRAPVPGGWLIMAEQEVFHHVPGYGRDNMRSEGYRTSTTFVPDPLHTW